MTENALRKKQYECQGVIISHNETIAEPTDPDTVHHRKYSGANISHGETIEEVPEYIPKKKYMWTTIVDFFKQKQRFGRHPFMIPSNM